MGLFDKLFKGANLQDPVRGTAQVVSCSGYRGDGVYQNGHMELVIQAEGISARAVQFQGLMHRDRWPHPGMVLPVSIDRADPSRFRIEWDEVQSGQARGQQAAEAIAAAQGPGVQPPAAPPPPTSVAPAPQPGGVDDRVALLERLAKLREQGALTDEEFEAQKQQILGT